MTIPIGKATKFIVDEIKTLISAVEHYFQVILIKKGMACCFYIVTVRILPNFLKQKNYI